MKARLYPKKEQHTVDQRRINNTAHVWMSADKVEALGDTQLQVASPLPKIRRAWLHFIARTIYDWSYTGSELK